MTKFLWIIGGATLAAAVYVVMNQSVGPLAPADGVEDTAARLGAWGTKQRVTGAGGQVLGRVEQGAANLAGNPDLADQGVFDEAAGAMKNAAGKAAQAVGSTIHEINK